MTVDALLNFVKSFWNTVILRKQNAPAANTSTAPSPTAAIEGEDVSTFQLAWGQKVSSAFRTKVLDICRSFGWTDDHASWLMSCMAFESGETFSPSIKNAAGSGATGLIQFMPATARGMGVTTADLAELTAEQQLDFVKQYFKPYAARVKSLPDMYMAILLPKYVGQPDSAVLFSDGIAYRQNAGLDTNRDGRVTKAEAASKVAAKLSKGLMAATKEPSV